MKASTYSDGTYANKRRIRQYLIILQVFKSSIQNGNNNKQRYGKFVL